MLVCPGDIIVGDDEGVVVILHSMLGDVVDEVLLRQDREDFIRMMLSQGACLRGLFTAGPEMEGRFQECHAQKGR